MEWNSIGIVCGCHQKENYGVTRQPGFPTYTLYTVLFLDKICELRCKYRDTKITKTGILAHPSGQVLTLENDVIIPLSQLSIYEIFHAGFQKRTERKTIIWNGPNTEDSKKFPATGHYLMGTKALHA